MDASPVDAADAPTLDAAGLDAPDAADLDAPAPDAGAACVPTGGTATFGGHCDSLELAVFTYDDRAPEVHLYGELIPGGIGVTACSAVDEVEVRRGSVSLATIPGTGPLRPEPESLLAAGASVPEVAAICTGDARRFGGFGLLVRGRIDGGTFEARCADAEGSTRWPPALRVTCHHNVPERPPFASAALREWPSLPLISELTVDVPGAAVATVDPTVQIIPEVSPFGELPIAPFRTEGWEVRVGASPYGPGSRVALTNRRPALTTELCPAPTAGPPPPPSPPPVFLVRITGSGERGPFRTEGTVLSCFRDRVGF